VRQGQQQNRRGRSNRHNTGGGGHSNGHNGGGGGGGSNRKQQNPLTRSYESNGPDVKVRGTPAHIAEKYMTLARDALSSGDPVLAESYFQHAEHYNRIIMAYREQFQGQNDANGQPYRFRTASADGNDSDEFGDDQMAGNDEQLGGDEGRAPQPVAAQNTDAQADRQSERPSDRQGERSFPDRQDRPERFNRNDQGDRGNDRQSAGFQPRGERNFDGQDRQFKRDRNDRFNDRNDRNRNPNEQRGRFNDQNRNFENRDGQAPRDGQTRDQQARDPQARDQQNRDAPASGERRFDRDQRDRGGYRQGLDRSGQDRGVPADRPLSDRQERPERIEGGDRPHERHVPERRFPQRTPAPVVAQEQPAPEWVAPARPTSDLPADRQSLDRRVEVETSAPKADRRPSEPIAATAVDATDMAAPAIPAAKRRGRPPAAAAASGERFQEHDQPTFLRRAPRKAKAEKPEAATSDGEPGDKPVE
jgi:Domain of unknown function (DUF4167)